MVKLHTPASIAAPASRYSHGAEAGPNARWLHISGQVGTNADGSIAEGIEAQIHRVWQNTLAVLEEAGMGVRDIVKINTLLMDRADLAMMRDIRDSYLGDHPAASTLFVVAALAHPDWLIEMETIAAKEA
ncbi:MAG: RidA family protein [Alphaproteobacteria bacterium]|jgi:enamine deaminase RidA (YjgF/YER057c/UK114 family)|nr:RidA family protein [Alphaproteobacteria bacterium]MDP6818467.1 RidA family protein [Alphaproteobacteria bacterium]